MSEPEGSRLVGQFVGDPGVRQCFLSFFDNSYYLMYMLVILWRIGVAYIGEMEKVLQKKKEKKKSVELSIYSPSLYEYEPLPEHTIGGFARNLVKEKSLSNSWHSDLSKYRSLSRREGLEPIRGGSTDLPLIPGTFYIKESRKYLLHRYCREEIGPGIKNECTRLATKITASYTYSTENSYIHSFCLIYSKAVKI